MKFCLFSLVIASLVSSSAFADSPKAQRAKSFPDVYIHCSEEKNRQVSQTFTFQNLDLWLLRKEKFAVAEYTNSASKDPKGEYRGGMKSAMECDRQMCRNVDPSRVGILFVGAERNLFEEPAETGPIELLVHLTTCGTYPNNWCGILPETDKQMAEYLKERILYHRFLLHCEWKKQP